MSTRHTIEEFMEETVELRSKLTRSDLPDDERKAHERTLMEKVYDDFRTFTLVQFSINAFTFRKDSHHVTLDYTDYSLTNHYAHLG